MKRPKCMEKRILDDVPVKEICPKCGSEMFPVFQHDNDRWMCTCGHSEKVKS